MILRWPWPFKQDMLEYKHVKVKVRSNMTSIYLTLTWPNDLDTQGMVKMYL